MSDGQVRAAVIAEPGGTASPGWVPRPRATTGRALVDVEVVSLNPADLMRASGAYPGVAAEFPMVGGLEGVGRVVRSDRLPAGTRVYWQGDGTLAEQVAVDDDALHVVPDGVPDDVAVTLGVAGVTAYLALSDVGALRPGENVLVLGASGAVGAFGVQLARVLSAGHVVAAGRDRTALARLDGVADEVVVLDEGSPYAEQLAGARPRGHDVVLDPVFGPLLTASLQVLAPRGRIVTVGASAAPQAVVTADLLARGASIRTYNGHHVPRAGFHAGYAAVAQIAAAGRLAVEREVVPWERVADAWAELAAGPRHKLVVALP